MFVSQNTKLWKNRNIKYACIYVKYAIITSGTQQARGEGGTKQGDHGKGREGWWEQALGG
jgi:hypothetical protein